MARLMLIGDVAQVELITDPKDGQVIARCHLHQPRVTTGIGCRWQEQYDDLRDAAEYAADHADTGGGLSSARGEYFGR